MCVLLMCLWNSVFLLKYSKLFFYGTYLFLWISHLKWRRKLFSVSAYKERSSLENFRPQKSCMESYNEMCFFKPNSDAGSCYNFVDSIYLPSTFFWRIHVSSIQTILDLLLVVLTLLLSEKQFWNKHCVLVLFCFLELFSSGSVWCPLCPEDQGK